MVGRILVSLLLLAVTSASGQEQKILSPRDSVYLTFGHDSISVNYGRPSMRGRVIMGSLVPWNQVWRTGANLATHLRTNFDLMMDGVPLPRGVYTLWTLPSPTGWKIILNKQTGQWGTRYDERQDLARFDATVDHLDSPIDTFTIALQAAGPSSGRLVLSWENTRVWTPFEKNDHIRPISPSDSSMTTLGSAQVKIVYSKPYIRGREIWGVVVPYDSVWRTGANNPTTLTSTGTIRIGDVTLEAGSYVLRSIPTEKALTLLINRKPSKPGPIPDSEILGRVPMTARVPEEKIDPFHIWFAVGPDGESLLKVGWADREYSAKLAR